MPLPHQLRRSRPLRSRRLQPLGVPWKSRSQGPRVSLVSPRSQCGETPPSRTELSQRTLGFSRFDVVSSLGLALVQADCSLFSFSCAGHVAAAAVGSACTYAVATRDEMSASNNQQRSRKAAFSPHDVQHLSRAPFYPQQGTVTNAATRGRRQSSRQRGTAELMSAQGNSGRRRLRYPSTVYSTEHGIAPIIPTKLWLVAATASS